MTGSAEQVQGAIPVTRVLLVEDDAVLRSLIEEYFERVGYRVVGAADGAEGLRLALAEDFDLIICDLILPKLAGDRLCTQLLEQRPELVNRIVVATGDSLTPEATQFLQRTGLACIRKPFGLGELTDMIRERVKRNEAGGTT